MEHIARLAVIEQKLKFSSAFTDFLQLILELLETTASGTEFYEAINTVESLKIFLDVTEIMEYIEYIGLQIEHCDSHVRFSRENINLSIAKEAITNKLGYLGVTRRSDFSISKEDVENKLRHLGFTLRSNQQNTGAIKKRTVPPPPVEKIQVLNTTNRFLLQMQHTANRVLRYEDAGLQERARGRVPVVTLQVRAMEAARDQQRDIKEGIRDKETPYEMLLLEQLVTWFKTSFFSWMDKPECDTCKGTTVATGIEQRTIDDDVCRVELYKCTSCDRRAEFVRHNEPGVLLTSRTGRCGEWAICFALLCRALDYDARYVVDITDHVWCEIYNAYEQRWIHVDPCEAAIDKPLMYEHGWGKKLEYVIAYSRDDVQDVTWRYSSHHSQVISRRHLVYEGTLLEALFKLREALQRHLPESRVRFLQKRTVRELAEMMAERKPSDYENAGRQSGSKEWRQQRGETGATTHSFRLGAGEHTVEYYPVRDRYLVDRADSGMRWRDGAWQCENLRRNVETDWQMVYLARSDGAHPGMITWRIEAENDAKIERMSFRVVFKEFDNGRVHWTYSVDGGEFEELVFETVDDLSGEASTRITGASREVKLRCTLSGGRGDNPWQHAQIMRAPLSAKNYALRLSVKLT